VAYEMTWKCDVCGEYRRPDDLITMLWRPASATTQDFSNKLDICTGCQDQHITPDVLKRFGLAQDGDYEQG